MLQWNGSTWACSNAGTGTITGVFGGTDLTGQGTSGNVTLNLDITKVPQLATANIFAAKQSISSGDLALGNGNIDLPDTNGSGAGVITLGGFAFAHVCCPSTHGNTFVGISAGTFASGVLQNTAEGYQALSSNAGNDNTASGAYALNSNGNGNNNTASGAVALYLNTSGTDNTATGYQALQSNSTGSYNTATGVQALAANTTASGNTASGYQALAANTTGIENTAAGYKALFSNTTASKNTASGAQALHSNTTGDANTASGYYALVFNTTGSSNAAFGFGTLQHNTTGTDNTAIGIGALYFNTTGNTNTAIGDAALEFNNTGSNNTALGVNAGPDPNSSNLTNATAIGANAIVSESNALVLGGTGSNAVKVGIGTATPTNVFTIAQGAGHAIADAWDTYSSRRWKTNIRTLQGSLGAIQRLRGVSYELKANGKHEIGVIAEEVGKVVPEVVSYEENGQDARGVDYSRLTALLIEATKEQQALIQKQSEQIRRQQRQIRAERTRGDAQQAEIAHLTSQVKAIQASLKTNSGRDAAVRTAAVQVPAVVR